jgi:hypothetical protein
VSRTYWRKMIRMTFREIDRRKRQRHALDAYTEAAAKRAEAERKLLVLDIGQLASARQFRIRRGFRVRSLLTEGTYRLNISPNGKALGIYSARVRIKADGRAYGVCDVCGGLVRKLCFTHDANTNRQGLACYRCIGLPDVPRFPRSLQAKPRLPDHPRA